MSVNSYLSNRASSAVLSEDERKSINTSTTTLGTRLDSWFKVDGDKLQSHFRFGSQTRGTILPRRDDQHSDVDYMVVFEKGGRKPQSYLDRLKKFVEGKYSTSEVYQSSPTIVLELNHIKFELVPALQYYGSTYNIPKEPNDWQTTSPNDFNATLEEKNKNNQYMFVLQRYGTLPMVMSSIPISLRSGYVNGATGWRITSATTFSQCLTTCSPQTPQRGEMRR
jgi:hypothetical protein